MVVSAVALTGLPVFTHNRNVTKLQIGDVGWGGIGGKFILCLSGNEEKKNKIRSSDGWRNISSLKA